MNDVQDILRSITSRPRACRHLHKEPPATHLFRLKLLPAPQKVSVPPLQVGVGLHHRMAGEGEVKVGLAIPEGVVSYVEVRSTRQ